MLLQRKQYLAETLQVILFKNDVLLARTKLEKKVPSSQKVTLFLRYKIFNRDAINLVFLFI